MSNLDGASEGKRKLLANIAMSVILYGAQIWADAINTREYQRTEMISVQWKAALRCVKAYRTVSTESVCVLAGPQLRPIDNGDKEVIKFCRMWQASDKTEFCH